MAVRPQLPAHLQPRLVALVVAGGAVGTAARAALEDALGAPPGQVPWATFAINVSGAFLLGLLLELLAAAAPDGRRRTLQLTLGTGLLGGFTTYSTFVLEAVGLGSNGALAVAVAYVAASVVGGFGAALLAMSTTRRVANRLAGRHP